MCQFPWNSSILETQAIELTTGAHLQQANRDARSTQITALAILEHDCGR